MSEREALHLRYLEARALKEELLVKQLKTDFDARSQKKVRFYKDPKFLKPVIAGMTLASLFAGYFQYVFLPTQQKLQAEIDTASFVSAQKRVLSVDVHKAKKYLEHQFGGRESVIFTGPLPVRLAISRWLLGSDQANRLI